MSVFLRGTHVDVLAPDACDEPFVHRRRAWLLPTGGLGARPQDDGDVGVVWTLLGDATTLGSMALAHIDWISRRAHLVASLVADAPGDAVSEALTIFVRYAQDELAIDRIEARVRGTDPATRDVLLRLGFREEGKLVAAWHEGASVDLVLMARVVSTGP
jgi:RimJ/RimL family protein N-acetyltransferase